jgi:hypothetical protein
LDVSVAAYFTAIHATLTSGLPNTGNQIDLADSRVLKTEHCTPRTLYACPLDLKTPFSRSGAAMQSP